jgi:hypothetical protein
MPNKRLPFRAISVIVLTLAAMFFGAACAPAGAGDAPLAADEGGLLAGTVTYGAAPVPGARVELRPPDWRTNPEPVSASVVTDGAGQFALHNPPAGEYVLVGVFPDGEADEGGWPNVTIAPGQRIADLVVPLERRLTLTEPAAEAIVPITPTLRWEPFAAAKRYRVWLIDAGTTEALVDAVTTEPRLALAVALPPGRTYRWVVNAVGADGMVLASGCQEFALAADANP